MALIPPFFLDCVVAIGRMGNDGNKQWIGTGFLLGRPYLSDQGNGHYHVFLVTNKHVLAEKNSVIVRFNPQEDESARDYEIPLRDQSAKVLWSGHPDAELDIAVIQLNPNILYKHKVRFNYFAADQHMLTMPHMARMGVSEGDYIYVLGFPMGIVAPDRQYTVARSGIIARFRDTIEGQSKDFLVDVSIFPGNSGGPVITKPEMISVDGTQAVDKAALIGMITSYVPYKDVAISQRTQRPRVVFEENSGLAAAVPSDFILQAIDHCLATKATATVYQQGEQI